MSSEEVTEYLRKAAAAVTEAQRLLDMGNSTLTNSARVESWSAVSQSWARLAEVTRDTQPDFAMVEDQEDNRIRPDQLVGGLPGGYTPGNDRHGFIPPQGRGINAQCIVSHCGLKYADPIHFTPREAHDRYLAAAESPREAWFPDQPALTAGTPVADGVTTAMQQAAENAAETTTGGVVPQPRVPEWHDFTDVIEAATSVERVLIVMRAAGVEYQQLLIAALLEHTDGSVRIRRQSLVKSLDFRLEVIDELDDLIHIRLQRGELAQPDL